MPSKARAYLSIFRIRAAQGLQYRMSALSGASISVFYGLIMVVVYTVFFTHGNRLSGGALTLEQTVTYTWLTQMLLGFQMLNVDSDIQSKIVSGDVGVELCRPLDLYDHWFMKTLALRTTEGLFRCVLTFIVAVLLPAGWRLGPPVSLAGLLLALLSFLCAILLCNAYGMLVNTVRLGITWGEGPTNMLLFITGVLSGAYLPLQLWPDAMQRFLLYQPFAGYLDLPVRLYLGSMPLSGAPGAMALQLAWSMAFIAAGKLLMRRKTRNLIVQGG